MEDATHLVFGSFRIDTADRRLWNRQQAVKLSPLAFTLLSHFVRHPRRFVTKDELLRALSRSESSDEILYGLIRELRKALGDDRHEPQFIENVPSEGHRFIVSVSTLGSASRSTPAPSPQFPPPAAISDTWQVPPGFVGREVELQQLHRLLDKALTGERQIAFLAGEPGVGKTTLARAFLQEVTTVGLGAVGRGQCIEQYGAGEAYLPMLEAIGRLCRSPGGEFLPHWLRQHAPTWLIQLPSFLELADYEALQRQLQGTTRDRMLRELLEAVELLTPKYPLVLLLEDLHWSDYSTLDLLSAFARRSELARLLVIGTYRPGEMLSNDHPLCGVMRELLTHRLCTEFTLTLLSETATRDYLTLRFPRHTFPEQLVHSLYLRTEGNPLFFTNILEDWVARGILAEDEYGWKVQRDVSTIMGETPESLRHLVARQREQLLPEEKRILEAASVAGMEFSTVAVAAALRADVGEVEEWCAGLVNRQMFLRAAGVSTWPDGTVVERYSFRHALYQQLWHERVGLVRRQRFHLRIGEQLERAYLNHTSEIATELALHFGEARDHLRAMQYHQQAGENAIRRFAHQEVVTHLTKSLEFLSSLPETPERTRQELGLRTALGVTMQAVRGYGNPVVAQAYARARELSQQVKEPAQLFRVLFGLFQFHLTQAENTVAYELTEQLLGLAQSARDPGLLVEAHGTMGITLFYLGELTAARTHLEQGKALYDREQHRNHAVAYGQDPWVACQGFWAQLVWLLGYPDQARKGIYEAWTTAQELAHPFSEAFALTDVALVHQLCRETRLCRERAEATVALACQHGFPFWESGGTILRGWALAEQGQSEEGIELMQRGLAAKRTMGAELTRRYYTALLVDQYGKSGRLPEAFLLLEETLATIPRTGERWWEAEIYRLKGELMLQPENQKSKGENQKAKITDPRPLTSAPQAEAEGYFLKAIEIAQRQSAKSLELRAVMSLSRLRQRQGKKAEARKALSKIYHWFSEGFDTPDLQEAKALLTALS
mgnify:CR=1 FL=1